MAAFNASCLNNTIGNLTLNMTSCSGATPAGQQPSSAAFCRMETNNAVYPLLVLCLFAVLENIFTGYIIYANNILRTPTNVFVFSLCIADGLCAGVLLPVAVFCKGSLLYGYLAAMIVFTYGANLSAVTYERMVSITKPLRYQSIMTKRVAFRIALLAWVVPISFSLLPLIWKGDVNSKEHSVYIIIAVAVFLVSPFFFICFVYARIAVEVHRLLKSSRHLQVFSFDDREKERKPFTTRLRRNLCCSSSAKRNSMLAEQPRFRHGKRCSSLVGENTISVDLSPDLSRECPTFFRKDRNTKTTNVLCKNRSNNNSCDEDGDIHEVVPLAKHPIRQSKVDEEDVENIECNYDGLSGDTTRLRLEKEKMIDVSEPPFDTDLSGCYFEKEADPPTVNGGSGATVSTRESCLSEEETRPPGVRQETVNFANGQTARLLNNDTDLQSDLVPSVDAMPVGKNAGQNGGKNAGQNGAKNAAGKHRRSIFAKMKRMRSNQSSMSSGEDGASRRRSRAIKLRHILDEVKASTAFAAVAVTYMFTWIPVIYMTFMEAIKMLDKVPVESITEVNTWTIAVNAAIDPFFYALILRNFRKTIRKHFRKMRCECY